MMLISNNGLRFAFNKRELAVLTSVMADSEREALAALWLHPSKGQTWATDGHRAVLAERRLAAAKGSTQGKPVAIPAATAHHAAKTARARDLIVIDIGGDRVSIDIREPTTANDTIETFEQLDRGTRSKHTVTCSRHRGGLGSIDKMFPVHHERGSKGAIVPLNPSLLTPLAQLGRLAEPTGQVWINLGKIHEPVVFVARDEYETVWRMLVMPLRAQPTDHPDHGRDAEKATKKRGRTRRASVRAAS